MTHKSCCKRTKRPKGKNAVDEFVALNYPTKVPGSKGDKNRIRNPEEDIPVEKQQENRKRWWFRLKPDPSIPLLDGSGDGKSRGVLSGSLEAKPIGSNDRLVCFNACSLKRLNIPGRGRVLCGFSWNVLLLNPTPGGSPSACRASGWIPLDALAFKSEATRKRMLAELKNGSCCARRYKEWGKSLTKGPPKKYKFRTISELQSLMVKLGNGQGMKTYFKDNKKGGIQKRIKQCNGNQEVLKEKFGICPRPRAGCLADYLPRTPDFKNGQGNTNLNANISTPARSNKPTMAPIPLDIFPAGHTFNRLSFRNNKRVLGVVFSMNKNKDKLNKPIGRVVWYYGYCDVIGKSSSERRYGWVPALALKKA